MSDQVFRLSAQGVNPDLARATGSYDPIELGAVDSKRLEDFLGRLAALSLPEGLDRGEDVCPPRIIVSCPRGEFDINLADNDGTLYCDTLGGNIGIPQVMMVLTGERQDDSESRPPSRPSHCPKCGEALAVGDAFCAGCGVPIEKAPGPDATGRGEPVKKSRKEEKRRQTDARIHEETGSDLERLSREVIQVMAAPLPLRHYRERFPFLLEGEKSTTWDTLREFMFRQNPPPAIHACLTAPPCDWAIQKPGFFRRLLTLIIDFPLLIVLLSLMIKNGPTICRAMGFASNSTGEGIVMLSSFLFGFVGYYVLTESVLGASPGGFLLGLRVIDDYGKPPTIGFLVMRQIWKILDIFFLFLGGAARVRLPPTTHVSMTIPELHPGNVVIR